MGVVEVAVLCYGNFAATLLASARRRPISTGSSKKNPPKFSDTCSVRADGQFIGCLGHWAERGREDSNMIEFFCTTLYTMQIKLYSDGKVI